MPNTFYPTQVGFTPSGSFQGSQVIIGRNIDVQWEAIGFGAGGRPDPVNNMVINLTFTANNGTALRVGEVRLNAEELFDIAIENNLQDDTIELTFREISVCETDDEGNASEKKMIILASQTYATGIA